MPATPNAPTPNAPRPNGLGLVAADLSKTLAFYRDLGLDIPADAGTDMPHVEVTLAGGFTLMFDPIEVIRSFDPDWIEPTGSSRLSLAFESASPADVDEKYAAMLNAGHHGHLQPWDAFWGQRYASLRDPDGTGVDLYAPLATD